MARVQGEIGRKLVTLSATVLLIAGIYMAATGPYNFGKPFVGIGVLIIVVLLGLGGAFFAPTERKASELANRDIAAAGTARSSSAPNTRLSPRGCERSGSAPCSSS